MKKYVIAISLFTFIASSMAFAGWGVAVGGRGGVAVAGNRGHYYGGAAVIVRPAYPVYTPVYVAPIPAYHGYPAVPHQVIPPSPYYGAIWISGYWVHDRGVYNWRAGYWR